MAYQTIKKSKNQQGKELINLIFQGKINQVSELVFLHKHNLVAGVDDAKACVATIYGIPVTHGATQEDYKILDRKPLNLSSVANEYIGTVVPGNIFEGYVACWWKIEYDDTYDNALTDLTNVTMVFKDTNAIMPYANNPGA